MQYISVRILGMKFYLSVVHGINLVLVVLVCTVVLDNKEMPDLSEECLLLGVTSSVKDASKLMTMMQGAQELTDEEIINAVQGSSMTDNDNEELFSRTATISHHTHTYRQKIASALA